MAKSIGKKAPAKPKPPAPRQAAAGMPAWFAAGTIVLLVALALMVVALLYRTSRPVQQPVVKDQRPATAEYTTTVVFTQPVCSGLAWQNDNMADGSLYGESPISGGDCWIVAQCWTDKPETERWIFAVRPGYTVWLSGHRGGSGWYFAGSEADVLANLAQQASELEKRDGKMRTTVVILPDGAKLFRLVTRVK